VPHVETYKDYTPVLVDDIISTARTMIETVNHLKSSGMKPAVCIGVHAVFANNAYQELIKAGASSIITCNTIQHESNRIDLSDQIIQALKKITDTLIS
jgi:ribose-phosphate pyrophosphokinase